MAGKPVGGQTTVVVHPLVLLSVVDHYNRACKQSKKRAVGCLLGSWRKGNVLDVANSFALPFEEDPKNPSVWFLDHDYLESMFAMFRKVNAREKIIGWYHTGPKLAQNDILINDVIRRFVPHPILVVIDAEPKEVGLPTRAYVAVEEVHDDGTPSTNTFAHVSSEIGAEEAEEVGVEHLLRDIKDVGDLGTLTHRIQYQLASLKGLAQNLREVSEYLSLVEQGKLPVNHQIVYALQDTFNLLPNLEVDEFIRALSIKTNDQMLAVYLATTVRSIIALHELINNKLELRQAEKKEEDGEEKAEKAAEKDKADKAKEEKGDAAKKSEDSKSA